MHRNQLFNAYFEFEKRLETCEMNIWIIDYEDIDFGALLRF